jgi:Na+/proline symporter
LSGKKQASSLLLAIGFLVKMFPALLFSLVWKKWKIREAVAATLLFLLLLVMVYGALFLLSPDSLWRLLFRRRIKVRGKRSGRWLMRISRREFRRIS